MSVLIAVAVSYLLGAIPAAYLLVKMIKGVDIRECGSGNVGATNASRIIGKKLGAIVLIFDVVKGVLAVVVVGAYCARFVSISPVSVQSLCGLSVVAGHVFNVFLKGRGGKGVATGAGVMLGIAPGALSIGGGVFLLVVIATKYVSLGSIIASVVIPFAMIGLGYPSSAIIMSAALCVLIVAKHNSNIKRLLAGQERKVFAKQ